MTRDKDAIKSRKSGKKCKHKCFGSEKANLINIKRGFKDRGSQRVQRWTKENDGRVLCPQLPGTLIRLFGNAFLIHDEP